MLLSYVLILGGYYLYVSYTCGPNTTDLKVMKPQGTVIVNYILESGIHESLADIENSLYDMKGCKRNERYEEDSYKFTKNKDEADYMIIKEECHFETEGRKYEVDFWFVEHFKTIDSTHGTLRLRNIITKTGILYSFQIDRNGNITTDFQKYPVIYSVKSTGICNPMRM